MLAGQLSAPYFERFMLDLNRFNASDESWQNAVFWQQSPKERS